MIPTAMLSANRQARASRRGVTAFVLVLGSWLAVGPMAVRGVEVGFPPLRQLNPENFGAAGQNYALAQDSRGVVYLGNLSGLFAFDGEWWQQLEDESAAMVGALAADAQGRVAVGSVDQIGYLEPLAAGGLRYRSLVEELPAGTPPLGFVLAAHALPAAGFAFLTESSLWTSTGHDGEQPLLAKIADVSPEPVPHSFLVDGELLVWQAQGLFRLTGSHLESMPGGERFASRSIATILSWGDGARLVSVAGEGLVVWRNGVEEPFDSQASAWAKSNGVTSAVRLADGRVAIGSERGGLLVLSAAGRIERAIDSTSGLPADHVRGLLEDREGGLWLALDTGLVRLEMASPVSVFDARLGIKGSAMAFARVDSRLWVGTTAGLFRLEDDAVAGGTSAIRVPGFPTTVFALAAVRGELLVGTRGGLFTLGDQGSRLMAGSGGQTVYCLKGSTVDPSVLWVGTRTGLGRARRLGSGDWRFEGIVPGSPRVVRTIVERAPSRLWLGTAFEGVVRAELLPDGPFSTTSISQGVGEGENEIYELGDLIVVPLDNEVRVVEETTGALVLDPRLAALQGQGLAFMVAEDRRGNVWLNTTPPSAILKLADGSYDPVARFPPGIASTDNQGLFADSDGSVWIGGERGLVHFVGDVASAATLAAPVLRRVAIGQDEVAVAAGSSSPELRAYGKRVRVEIGPCSYRGRLRYQYRLEPQDDDWGRAHDEAFVEFTNLPPGSFSLHFRSLAPGGEVSPASRFSFSVRPPWYRMPVAWVVWTLLAVLVTAALIGGYARHLRRKANLLETQVAKKTLELSRAVDDLRATHSELEEKHGLLFSANAQLAELSQRDDLTGIANRRCLFRALADEWARAARAESPLSFVLFDLDHFKKLNDRLGHQEGDLCLRRVGELLASEVRRPGDLAARYGGEEFALLLPGTDRSGALLLAERIRAAIAALAIEIPEAPAGRLTASFGVVSLTPRSADAEEELVQAADRALYAAKAQGRNRVVSGG